MEGYRRIYSTSYAVDPGYRWYDLNVMNIRNSTIPFRHYPSDYD